MKKNQEQHPSDDAPSQPLPGWTVQRFSDEEIEDGETAGWWARGPTRATVEEAFRDVPRMRVFVVSDDYQAAREAAKAAPDEKLADIVATLMQRTLQGIGVPRTDKAPPRRPDLDEAAEHAEPGRGHAEPDAFFARSHERTLIQRVIDAAEALRPTGEREATQLRTALWGALDDLLIHRRGHVGPGTERPLLDGWTPPGMRTETPANEPSGISGWLPPLDEEDERLVDRLVADRTPPGRRMTDPCREFVAAVRAALAQIDEYETSTSFSAVEEIKDALRALDEESGDEEVKRG